MSGVIEDVQIALRGGAPTQISFRVLKRCDYVFSDGALKEWVDWKDYYKCEAGLWMVDGWPVAFVFSKQGEDRTQTHIYGSVASSSSDGGSYTLTPKNFVDRRTETYHEITLNPGNYVLSIYGETLLYLDRIDDGEGAEQDFSTKLGNRIYILRFLSHLPFYNEYGCCRINYDRTDPREQREHSYSKLLRELAPFLRGQAPTTPAQRKSRIRPVLKRRRRVRVGSRNR